MLDYIRSILSFIFAVSVMYMLLDCEIKNKKKAYQIGFFTILIITLDGFILFYYDYPFFMKFYPLLVHLPVFLAFLFISKFKATKVFFILSTLIAISTSFSMVGLSIAFIFNFNKDVANIICYILYLPTWFMLYKYLRPPFLYVLRNSNQGWLGFSIIPISYSVLIYSIGMYNLNEVIDKFSVKYGVLLFIMVFSVYFLFLRFFKQIREQLILQNEQNLLINQIAAAQLYFEALEESQEKTILYRHDMRHHLNLINSYLAYNNKDAAQKYIAEVDQTIDNAVVEKYCTNYTVNLILYSYISHAKKEDIEVDAQIELPEQNIISDMDLCVIFGNTIENAVNACKCISSIKDKYIKIVCKNKNNKVFIQITNSYEGKVDFLDDIPISNKENHGLGTKSIAAIAHKYGGVYSFDAERGVFTTSIIL